MSKVDSNSSRSGFFPRSKTANDTKLKPRGIQQNYLQRNAPARMKELESTSRGHAKVEIPNAVKDYAKIKKAVDQAPEVDNTAKIADLKKQIQQGSYSVDYDKLADKILSSEF
jgi:negative regulator of flagellin synthesis FlgM